MVRRNGVRLKDPPSRILLRARAKLKPMPAAWRTQELLAFDLETTGVDKIEDVPVSFALVTFEGGDIPAGAVAVHGISTEKAHSEGIPMAEAIEEIAAVLVDASRRSVPVVGFNLSYDLTMMDARCRALDGRGLIERGWKGPVLDPLVMDRGLDRWRKGPRTLGALCDRYGVVNAAAHDAQGDAVASAQLLLLMADALPEVGETEAETLYEQQIAWHKTWAGGFSDFLMSKGEKGFSDEEFLWPLQVITNTLF